MDALDEGQTRAAVLNAEPAALTGGGGGGGGGDGGGADDGGRARSKSGEKLESLRERMKKAAAEQDDLRNFDMSEWGKISVDQDYDDVTYGDHALWPVSKARRKIVEEERLIVGYAYCSSGAPFSVPGEL
ncbi:Serine/threonine protein kinase [Gracilaria domingensis]|nr:Serine/threonine protein kinase [Gracilaria domingensis]